MTANTFDDNIKKSFAVKINAHLAKPFEPQKLYGTLELMIKKSGEHFGEKHEM